MCIAIANKKGYPLSKKQFKNCWENNDNGAGMLYKENGKLMTTFEMSSWEALYKIYSSKVRKSNLLLHFRVSSKGATNVDMCHPFMVSDDLGFVHNGTIFSGLKDYPKEKSDTWAVNEQVFKHLPNDFYKYPVLMEILSSKTGNSKMAFMDSDEKFYFIGENKGEGHFCKKSGNWFSNKSYEQVNDFVWKGNEKVMKSNYTKYSGAPSYRNTDYKSVWEEQGGALCYKWSEDLRDNKLTNGFERTMMEIAEKARFFRAYRDANVMMEQFITYRGNTTTIRRAIKRVFNDFLYEDSMLEMNNCLRYYLAMNERERAGKRTKYGVLK